MMSPIERGSTAPVSIEPHDTDPAPAPPQGLLRFVPAAWLGMSGYLVAGVFLGLVLIVALSLSRGSDPVPPTSAGVITDQVVRLHAKDIGDTCWAGMQTSTARLTVLVDIGIDGRVNNVVANGASPTMKGCIETHVRNWEFLPQARPWQESLPFEVDRR